MRARIILLLSLVSISWGAEVMTQDEVRAQISASRGREQAAKSKIAILEGEVSQLRAQAEIARNDRRNLDAAILQKAGLTPAQVEIYQQKLVELYNQASAFEEQYQSSLKDWETAVNWAEYQWKELLANPVAILPRVDSLRIMVDAAVQGTRNALENAKAKLQVQEVVPPPAEPAPTPVPEPAPAPEPVPEPPIVRDVPQETGGPRTVEVLRASTLWGIAKIVYGDASKWQRLWRANAKQIKDPDRIEPGMMLIVPDGPVPKPASLKR